jgi:hypothetical protein
MEEPEVIERHRRGFAEARTRKCFGENMADWQVLVLANAATADECRNRFGPAGASRPQQSVQPVTTMVHAELARAYAQQSA